MRPSPDKGRCNTLKSSHLLSALSGVPASEPSPHLMSMVAGGLFLDIDDLGFSFKNNKDAVAILAIDNKTKAMIKADFINNIFLKQKIPAT